MDVSGVVEFENRRWAAHDQEIVERHRLALELVRQEPVLDVGGGDGLFLTLLRQRSGFQHLTLLDVSPVAVEKARQKGLTAEVLDISKSKFPFPDKSFGTVCALDLLEHLYDPLSVLKEMGRVGRTVVITVPNFHYWKDRWRMVFGSVPFQCKPQRGHVYWMNYPVLRRLFEDSGLSIEVLKLESFNRLGPVGSGLARLYPPLFAVSFAARGVAKLSPS